MELERDDLRQFGVLWSADGADDFGAPRVGQPVEIRCRWELGAGLVDSPLANTHTIAGRMFVDREIALESIVWPGRQSELPPAPENYLQVIDYQEIPDVKGRYVRRVVLLTRWNGRLPVAV